MTQSTFLADNQGSKCACGLELQAAIKQQLECEKASFHTPGHKGRLSLDIEQFACDLTELPGLDELSNASGVLQGLQARIASIWQARNSLISVNGASAALTAAILSCSNRGAEILLPRNVHRSALNALILTGLDPIWYEPDWLQDWGTWGGTDLSSFEHLLDERASSLAAVLICSPNYAGILCDLKKITALCRQKKIMLIVDEAHGAHLSKDSSLPSGALHYGADLVVHSLHKTLGAPTQTGILHIGKTCPLEDEVVRAALNTLQSSSPSYLLMLGIEKSLADLEGGSLQKALALAADLRRRIAQNPALELLDQKHKNTDPLHLLLSHRALSARKLCEALAQRGIYGETVLGNGVLLLLGLGSTQTDIDLLIDGLASIDSQISSDQKQSSYSGEPESTFCSKDKQAIAKPSFGAQHLNPRRAFFAKSCQLPLAQSLGQIASDWIAPCPPGYPVLAPGQRISREIIEILENDTSIRVVKHPQLEGDSDGPNTAS